MLLSIVATTSTPDGTSFEFELEDSEDETEWDAGAQACSEEELKDASRSLMDWIYDALEAEHEYRTSDENVAENIRINEYEFTEEGTRA